MSPTVLPWDLSDHDGDAVPLVPGPVRHLALLAAIVDDVILETFFAVCQWFWF